MEYCGVVNTVMDIDNLHYIDLFVRGEVDTTHSEQPENREPHKCEGWHWFDWDSLPPEDQLFLPLRLFINQGFNPFNRVNKPAPQTPSQPSTWIPNHHKRPGVGVGVLVTTPSQPGCVLLGVRKGSTGSGLFAIPGGHLEYGEDWCECGSREALEEAGLVLKNMEFCVAVNAVNPSEDYHYITLFVLGEIDNTEPQNLEPHLCEGWQWVEWEKFPPQDQLFCALKVLKQQGYHPFVSTQQ